MYLWEKSLSLLYSLLTASGLGSSAVWWPVTLPVCSPSVILSCCVWADSALGPQQPAWESVPAFPVAPRSSVCLYSQTFFRMRHVVTLDHVCQKQSFAVHAKASCSTCAVAILRWPKVHSACHVPARETSCRDITGNSIVQISQYLVYQDAPQRVLITIPAIACATERLFSFSGMLTMGCVNMERGNSRVVT